MVEGRSKQVFKTWLSERDETWRNTVDVVAMDGFTGFKTAAVEELKEDLVVVMDPFHVVRLAGQSLELCRRRVQQETLGHRGRPATRCTPPGEPCPPAPICSPTNSGKISALFADDAHIEVEATWGVYQAMIAAYRDPDRAPAKTKMQQADRQPQLRRSRQPWSSSARSAAH